jgi:alanine racemase
LDEEGDIMRESLENYSRVYARVDLGAIEYNLESMRGNIPAGTPICAVIKTDGYGHGAVEIAKDLEGRDYIWGYATATAEEAWELRDAGLLKPILILGYTFPYSYKILLKEGIRPTVFRPDMIQELNNAAKELMAEGALTGPAPVHVAVDTGMSRIGISPDESGISFVRELLQMDALKLEGVFTHFARADEKDLTNVREREVVFKEFTDRIENELGYEIPIRHCANSASIIAVPESSMNMVRAGVTIYGMWPSEEVPKDIIDLKPAMELISHIVMIKEVPAGTPVSYGGTFVTDKTTKIATVPVGYGDGYPRSLSGKGYVLIDGHKAPILGRVCMDQFMVDVSDIDGVREGDEVILLGRDKKSGEEISAELLGQLSGRFNYELTCDLNKRVPRIYVKD